MRWFAIIGIMLIVLGVAGFIIPVIPIHHTEQVAKIGSFTANEDKENDVVVPPYAGAVAIAAGIFLIVVGRRRA